MNGEVRACAGTTVWMSTRTYQIVARADQERADWSLHSAGSWDYHSDELKENKLRGRHCGPNVRKVLPIQKGEQPPALYQQAVQPPATGSSEIPAAVSRRITGTSSDRRAFNAAASLYNDTLAASRKVDIHGGPKREHDNPNWKTQDEIA